MTIRSVFNSFFSQALAVSAAVLILAGCSSMYYSTMEKVGVHKRDILVDRVEAAQEAQSDAQEKFSSALEEFATVVNIGDSDLKQAYERFNAEFEGAEQAADRVSERIDKVASVAEALFREWEKELDLYSNASLRQASKVRLQETRQRYATMLASMHRAEESMAPVLDAFRDHVLFLKHNLNAQAIGALKFEFASLKKDIDALIREMNASIESSQRFIAEIQA